jgi:hypothetical protein
MPVVRPANVVAGRKRFLDDLQPMVHSGLELKDHTAVAEGLRFQNYVPLAAIGDRVTRVQRFDRHQLGCSVCLHPKHSKAIL